MQTAMQRRMVGSLYMPADQKTIWGKKAMKSAAHRATGRPNRRAAIA